MKAAAKASPWLFPEDCVFPVVNPELHPLKKFARGIMYRGSIFGIVLHLVVFGGWLIGRNIKPAPPPAVVEIRIKNLNPTDLGVPPSIAQDQTADAQVQVAAQVAPPSIGVPEPVPDFQATTTTIATSEQIAEALTPVDVNQLGQSDSIVVNESALGDQNPSPDEFVAVEEVPVLIQIPPPVYPEMARAAEVEGVVMVRALVTKEGKVGDCRVIDGQPMLNDAAVASVKKASFKPALQQHKPVAVWVNIPIRFTLH